MRRWGSDTTLDSASAIGMNRCGLEILIRQDPALAEVRSSWRAFDEHYSNVGTRVVLPPDRPCPRIGSDPSTHAELFRSKRTLHASPSGKSERRCSSSNNAVGHSQKKNVPAPGSDLPGGGWGRTRMNIWVTSILGQLRGSCVFACAL